MSEERIFFGFVGIALSLFVGWLGSNRKIGFGWSFLLCLAFFPLGLIITLFSKKKNSPDFIEVKNKED